MSRLIFSSIKKNVFTCKTNLNKNLKEINLESKLIETQLGNVKNSIHILKKREKDLLDQLKYYQELEKGLKVF